MGSNGGVATAKTGPERPVLTLLSGPAVERLAASPVKEVVVTNTIAIPPERHFKQLTVLSIAGLLAKAIGYTHSDQSVSSLFD